MLRSSQSSSQLTSCLTKQEESVVDNRRCAALVLLRHVPCVALGGRGNQAVASPARAGGGRGEFGETATHVCWGLLHSLSATTSPPRPQGGQWRTSMFP